MLSAPVIKISRIFYGFCLALFVAVKPSWEKGCPAWENDLEDRITPTTADLVHRLIANCHYDKLQPPPTIDEQPLPVYVKVYFYFLKSYEAHNLQFTVYMLLQCRFVDPRLRFDPNLYNVTEIVGTKELGQLLWMPHVYFNNERQSMVMGPGANEVMTHIYFDGTVLYTKRVQTTLFCWMRLQKFPFDSQDCTLVLDSWSYNMSHLTLHWETSHPIHCRDELTLTEFTLVGDPIASQSVDDLNFDKDASGDFRKLLESFRGSPQNANGVNMTPKFVRTKPWQFYFYTRKDDAAATFKGTTLSPLYSPDKGNYSSLVVTFHLQRESGFYVYDYFIPSIFLVVVSWVSFWLEADAPMVSGRVVLGCSTMLAFIILAHQTGNSLPKVSYIKASEIWFLGCTAFIFGSLVEFAFVNTIYRSRRKQIGLKKVNSKYILKETLTPKAKRKEFDLERSTSCPNNLNSLWVTWKERSPYLGAELNKDLHKRSLPNVNELPKEKAAKGRDKGKAEDHPSPTLMTPREVSNWIDTRSRVIFPVSFVIFNIGYWCYVYYL